MGKHRAEDQPDGKSTSQRITGDMQYAHVNDKHRAKEAPKGVFGTRLGKRAANPKYYTDDK
jgi:hypothetical protein